MGRTGTWLVGAAVGALAAAAVVDAVVGGGAGGAPAPSAPPSEQRETPSAGDDFLSDERVVGELLYVDGDCRVRMLVLPDTRPTPPGDEACEFTTTPGGRLGYDGVAVAPVEPYAAVCRSGRVELVSTPGAGIPDAGEGSLVGRWPGCAPAWRPDGALTVVRGGEVVDLDLADPPAEPRVLLSRSDLARAFGGSPWNLQDARVRELAWLDETLLAAIVRDGEDGDDLLAVFRNGRLVGTTPSPYDALSDLRVSPRGTYVAARIGDRAGLVLLDRAGDFVALGLRGHAVTWSPDELWTAVAATDAIFVFETGRRANRFARIPIVARDLFWR